jgi:lipoprotein-anchoring transpeptidase ErfK/SrfK
MGLAVALSLVVSAPAGAQQSKKKQEQQVASAEGNKGELRSNVQTRSGLFASWFGPQRMLPETEALDGRLNSSKKKQFKVKPEFEPQLVEFERGYNRGTIIIDPKKKFLYLVESGGKARRYAIAVGREGLAFSGKGTVGDKQEWPRWTPTKDMQQREPAKYGRYKDGMDGGPDNPLGARAIYLYQGKKDTHIRIHGTNQPQSIGTASSNGCFRMINEHVIDLYGRVRMGAEIIVL